MISQSDLSVLYSILSNEKDSFESISNIFQKKFNKLEQFKVGMTLWYLIKENLINLSQRLASFYLLYDMYSSDQVQTTPFIPLLLESLEQSTNNIEKKALIDLIEFKFSSSKMTIEQYINENKNIEEIKIPDMTHYWRLHNTNKEKITKDISDWIRPIIYEHNKQPELAVNDSNTNNNNNNPLNAPPFDFSNMSPEEISYNYYEDNFLTYYPNSNYPFYEDEPIWIIPTLKYDFVWDFTMSNEFQTVSNLLNRQMRNKPLTEEQSTYLIEVINENPNILKEINFTPENLMLLVEKNHNLSGDILLALSKGIFFEKYLEIFLQKKWTVKSLIVISKILQKCDMPEKFICSYLNHIIQNCTEESQSDSRTRLAKLISIFITNLVENDHIKVEIIPTTVEKILNDLTGAEEYTKLKQILDNKRK